MNSSLRFFLHAFLLLWAAAPPVSAQNQLSSSRERPNIVWIVSEDNSKHYLRLYEAEGEPMPHIEALARQGLVFNHAFSQGPVCSVARSTIISGCYAPRTGAQYHRRTRHVPMPEGLHMFPYYLRQAGYYTTNNSKEDYNFIKGEGVWDESSRQASYRHRKAGQPFFHVQNFGITHEGQLHFSRQEMQQQPTQTDPGSITPFPYHPNTPTFRYTYARYHDLHQQLDAAIGDFLAQLEADDLMENTIIFYYGDHGGVLPGSKGYIYERGLHVPLVVYVPEKWRHLAPAPPGSRIDGFVRFIDLGPTVLHLAGVAVPEDMDGQPFLGADIELRQLNARDRVISYADRFDEKYDLVRALRKGRYKYMRNYQPFNFDGLYNYYRYKMLAYQEWRELFLAGKLNAVQQQFFLPRPAETLYDIEADPHETHNLATDPAYAQVLFALREELRASLKAMPDLSFFPESYFVAHGAANPVQFGQQHKAEIARLIEVADLSLLPFEQARPGIAQALASANPWQRYWGLIVCSSFGQAAAPFYPSAKKLARKDPEKLVRVRAAEFLGLTGRMRPQKVILKALAQARTATEANLIMNTITLLMDSPPGYAFDIRRSMLNPEWMARPNDLVARRMEYFEQK
ncbi:MAG: sulfatase [Bacteroidetes bacterium]|nr:MAG: sulfatase [Bacteroidota bacterium]